jgi:hypothetical protein
MKTPSMQMLLFVVSVVYVQRWFYIQSLSSSSTLPVFSRGIVVMAHFTGCNVIGAAVSMNFIFKFVAVPPSFVEYIALPPS